MKNLILVMSLFFCFSIGAQNENRIEINGKIIVEGNDLDDITIYNTASKQGVLTNKKGEFKIDVKVSDTIQVRALQYKDFDVVINKFTIESRSLRIFLIEQITQLDEILIRDKNLTGNLKEDLKTVKTFKPKLNTIYFAPERAPVLDETSSQFTRNNAQIAATVDQNRPLVNGLNLINVVDQLLLPLFRSEVDNKKEKGIPEVPVESIKYYFGSEFLSENFNIPMHRVEEFIRYVEDETFDFSLLNYGREMEFLEIINTKSKEFLKKKD
jgi:hypothetical protein